MVSNIISLRYPNSWIDKQNKSTRVGTQYLYLSGTSIATPICADIAALSLEADHTLMPDQVKIKLKSTAKPLPETDNENIQGKGWVDVVEAIKFDVHENL